MAKADPKDNAKAGAPVAGTDAPAGKSKKLLFLIAGVVVLALVGSGGAYAWLANRHDPAGGKEARKEASKPPVFVPLEVFTVNLQQEGEDHYLQVAMTLKVADAAQVELFKLNMPETRSRLLLLLSAKTPSELATSQGKEKLVADILSSLQKPFTAQDEKPEVTSVFFTSFVIQ